MRDAARTIISQTMETMGDVRQLFHIFISCCPTILTKECQSFFKQDENDVHDYAPSYHIFCIKMMKMVMINNNDDLDNDTDDIVLLLMMITIITLIVTEVTMIMMTMITLIICSDSSSCFRPPWLIRAGQVCTSKMIT